MGPGAQHCLPLVGRRRRRCSRLQPAGWRPAGDPCRVGLALLCLSQSLSSVCPSMLLQMDPAGQELPLNPPNWADLPAELWVNVFGNIDFTERCGLHRQWTDASVWQQAHQPRTQAASAICCRPSPRRCAAGTADWCSSAAAGSGLCTAPRCWPTCSWKQ